MPRRNKTRGMKMREHNEWHNCEHCHGHWGWKGGASGLYCLGFIGALIFYLQQATGFWNGVLGILKAIVWPAFVVYKLLGL